MCTVCMPVLEEGVGFSRTGVIDGCELPCGGWELDLCPLQEQQVLLATEPSLQSQIHYSKCKILLNFFLRQNLAVLPRLFLSYRCQMTLASAS